jgi:hypothetical protein
MKKGRKLGKKKKPGEFRAGSKTPGKEATLASSKRTA